MADLHVVLVQPEIPWNAGNAGRSCLAAGARLHLVRPLGFSLAERQVRRAGLDYWERVQPELWSDWESFERALPGLGAPWLFSADAERDYWDVDFCPPSALVFGREASGLPLVLRERYRERLVRVPQREVESGVRSLNLSTAVGIALWEVLRQRRAGAQTGPAREP